MANEGSTQVLLTKEPDQNRTTSADEEAKAEKQFLSPQKVPGCRYFSMVGCKQWAWSVSCVLHAGGRNGAGRVSEEVWFCEKATYSAKDFSGKSLL